VHLVTDKQHSQLIRSFVSRTDSLSNFMSWPYLGNKVPFTSFSEALFHDIQSTVTVIYHREVIDFPLTKNQLHEAESFLRRAAPHTCAIRLTPNHEYLAFAIHLVAWMEPQLGMLVIRRMTVISRKESVMEQESESSECVTPPHICYSPNDKCLCSTDLRSLVLRSFLSIFLCFCRYGVVK
jgi:hypothetical protein